jgi:hypothetical protein
LFESGGGVGEAGGSDEGGHVRHIGIVQCRCGFISGSLSVGDAAPKARSKEPAMAGSRCRMRTFNLGSLSINNRER